MLDALPPYAYAALLLIIIATVAYQRTLGWRTYSKLHRLKVR